MDMSDTIDQGKMQLTEKANELAETAKPYVDQAKPYVDKISSYAKGNPVEAMLMTGVVAFVLGSIFSSGRR